MACIPSLSRGVWTSRVALLCGTVLTVASAGCSAGGEGTKTPAPTNEPVITQVDNTLPTGTVGGRVYKFSDGSPMAGVTVTLNAGAVVLTMDTTDTGEFQFEDVPAGGNVSVRIEETDYHPARVVVALDDAAGNFPTRHANAYVGPVGLLARVGAPLQVRVLQPNGEPAAGAQVFLDMSAAFIVDDANGAPQLRGQLHEATTTDAAGTALFLSMPSPTVLATRFPTLTARLTVAAYGAGSDGLPTALGTTQDVALTSLLTQAGGVTIVLPPPGSTTALKIVASNLPDFITDRDVVSPGVIAPSTADQDSTLRLVFNQPVDPSTVEAVMVAEDGSPLDPNGNLTRLDVLVPGASPSDGGVSSTPATILELVMPRASEGVEANLYLRVAAPGGTPSMSVAAPVYFAQTAPLAIRSVRQVALATEDGQLGPQEVLEVTLNQPVGARDNSGNPVNSNAYLPVLVNISQVPRSADAVGTISEPLPRQPHRAGGFTTRVRFAMPADLMESFAPSPVTVTLDFNDSARRDGGPSGGGSATVVTPTGVPVGSVSGSGLSVTLLPTDVTPAP